MTPAEWGPPAWKFLHAVSFGYPTAPTDAQKAAAAALVASLAELVPCGACRRHWAAVIRDHPPDDDALASRDAFSHYLVDRHNDVNRELGRPAVSYVDAVTSLVHRPDPLRGARAVLWLAVASLLVALLVLAFGGARRPGA